MGDRTVEVLLNFCDPQTEVLCLWKVHLLEDVPIACWLVREIDLWEDSPIAPGLVREIDLWEDSPIAPGLVREIDLEVSPEISPERFLTR